jgi:sulfatase maturation enzyme AslB (radical SAM superfamily)
VAYSITLNEKSKLFLKIIFDATTKGQQKITYAFSTNAISLRNSICGTSISKHVFYLLPCPICS